MVSKRGMGWRRKAENELLQVEDVGKGWGKRIGRVKDATCPRCEEEEETAAHILFYNFRLWKNLRELRI